MKSYHRDWKYNIDAIFIQMRAKATDLGDMSRFRDKTLVSSVDEIGCHNGTETKPREFQERKGVQ